MDSINLPSTVVIPTNSPVWSDMVVNNPKQAIQQMNDGLPKQTMVTPNNMIQSVDPSINMTHVNPIR